MADDLTPVEETGRDNCFAPFTAGVLLCVKSLKALHVASNEAYGRGSATFEPGYKVGIRVGNCSLTAILTTFNTTSIPGDRARSLPETADSYTRNSRVKCKEACRYPLQSMQLGVALPRVDPVEARHEQA